MGHSFQAIDRGKNALDRTSNAGARQCETPAAASLDTNGVKCPGLGRTHPGVFVLCRRGAGACGFERVSASSLLLLRPLRRLSG